MLLFSCFAALSTAGICPKMVVLPDILHVSVKGSLQEKRAVGGGGGQVCEKGVASPPYS